MNTLQASQKNRRERIADAMRIEWNGYTDSYSTDNWLHVVQTVENAQANGVFTDLPIWFAGELHRVTLTAAQDLAGYYHEALHRMSQARAVR